MRGGEAALTSGSTELTPATVDDRQAEELAELFKALAHPVRIKLLSRLSTSRRYCGDLVADSGLAQSTVSHHLRILREAGIVSVEEQGTRTCYSIDRQRLQLICDRIGALRKW